MANEPTANIQDTAAAVEPSEGEKKFTQADVDRIVRKRLHEERARKDADQAQAAEPAAADQTENAAQAPDDRAAEMLQRETRLDCREYLMDHGYPAKLLDIVEPTDKESFAKKVEDLAGLFEAHFRERHFHGNRSVPPLAELDRPSFGAAVRRATGAEDLRHIPKNKYFTEGD